MVVTYTGTLREQGRIEWDGPIPVEEGVRVTLTIESPAPESQGKTPGHAMAQVMERISKTDLYKVFGDPLEWQREVRRSRPLPGRED